MIHLLDASVLIALGDAGHEHEAAALRFFENEAVRGGWATCPLTETFDSGIDASLIPGGAAALLRV